MLDCGSREEEKGTYVGEVLREGKAIVAGKGEALPGGSGDEVHGAAEEHEDEDEDQACRG